MRPKEVEYVSSPSDFGFGLMACFGQPNEVVVTVIVCFKTRQSVALFDCTFLTSAVSMRKACSTCRSQKEDKRPVDQSHRGQRSWPGSFWVSQIPCLCRPSMRNKCLLLNARDVLCYYAPRPWPWLSGTRGHLFFVSRWLQMQTWKLAIMITEPHLEMYQK